MPKTTSTKNIIFDEKTKGVKVIKTITEVFDKREIYNVYNNLKQQLSTFEKQIIQMQQAIENIKKDLRELGPIYDKIKDEVEKEKSEENV